jgi:aryl-alcohol dehydrogenase-like predicted oxidoreductase
LLGHFRGPIYPKNTEARHYFYDYFIYNVPGEKLPMEKRQLGKSGLKVYPFAFGGNVFGFTVNEETSFKLLDRFVGAGFNLVDTADVYSKWVPGNQGGESETIIGRWMKERRNREKVVIATKVGMELAADKKGLSKNHILRAAEDSLRRLQTDTIDLYQSHTDDPSVPIEETLEAYDQLIKQGKVRTIGASNYTAERLSLALKTSEQKRLPLYQTLQPLYNLYDRADYERTLEPVCSENGLGVIPYYGLASGFLTGKYRSEKDLGKSVRGDRVKNYLTDRGFRILEALDQVAKNLNATPAQISLAWLIARPSITAPIASATSVAQLDELIGAATLKLPAEALELLNRASG